MSDRRLHRTPPHHPPRTRSEDRVPSWTSLPSLPPGPPGHRPAVLCARFTGQGPKRGTAPQAGVHQAGRRPAGRMPTISSGSMSSARREAEDLGVEGKLGFQRPALVLGLAEAMALAFEEEVGVRQAVALESRHDALGLRGRHHLVIRALQHQDGAGDAVGVVDRRALPVALRRLRPGPQQVGVVLRLELVGDGREALEVAEAEVGDPGAEGVREAQRRQRREAAGAAAPDSEACAIDEALLGQPEGGVRAVVDVHDAPGIAELVTIGAAVSGRATVVDVHDGEAPARECLPLEAQRGARLARGAAMRHDHERRPLHRRAPATSRVRGRVVPGVRGPARRRSERRRAGALTGRQPRPARPPLSRRRSCRPVRRSRRTIAVGCVQEPPTNVTMPSRTRTSARLSAAMSRSRGGSPSRISSRRVRPCAEATATIVPSASTSKSERPKTHCGPANSASIGARGSDDLHARSPAVEVPPARPVGDEDERPVWRPARLGDRLGRSARDEDHLRRAIRRRRGARPRGRCHPRASAGSPR